MSQPSFPGWRQQFIVALFVAFLIIGAFASPRPAHAQESPLPTPTSVQAPSPLSSPTPGEAGQPISTTATTDAPSSLAGTALTSPGAIAVTVLVALVAIGGLVRYRQRA
jgi:hypothetical protein